MIMNTVIYYHIVSKQIIKCLNIERKKPMDKQRVQISNTICN